MQKRKRGELEAIIILENLGIEIDKSHCDDNSQKSMPDIKCKDGRLIEVTHTFHNNAIPKGISNFDRLQPGEDWDGYIQRHRDVEKACGDAYERINKRNYEKDNLRRLTSTGLDQFNKDAKLLKNHWGYDVTERDFYKQYSEFNCDHPTIVYSTKKILREITEDKAEKYPDGDVDLFIFVTEEEFRLFIEYMSQVNWNGCATGFLWQVHNAPFQTIYVCEWLFTKQEYNTDTPQLIILNKCKDAFKKECHNIRNPKKSEMFND